MHRTVRNRVDIHASYYDWEKDVPSGAIERYEKDGYEMYFFRQNDGFELTIRNPETMERETVFEVRSDDVCTTSPLYVSIIEYTLKNAEKICAQEQ